MSDKATDQVLREIAATIDIPDSSYEKANRRYLDLGDWFKRPEARAYAFDPHISPQGSFRLGTVHLSDEYDLDFGCRLCRGISKSTFTQKQLKELVGADLEDYRRARRIENRLEEKRRCWRLPYKDELPFHMDSVPSIPEDARQRQLLRAAMVRAGTLDALAEQVARFAGAITDTGSPCYGLITPNWHISNSEGYALWFESRMKLAPGLTEDLAIRAKAARVDSLPTWKWKTPLQMCVQILKRHRDVMFADNPDGKPISVIITTLAGQAYQGEQSLVLAMSRILADLGDYVNERKPRIPNPVNPAEDFADKWGHPDHAHLNLEGNFWDWLEQARADFKIVTQSRDSDFLAEQVKAKFGTRVDPGALRTAIGVGGIHVITSPKSHQISQPVRPWGRR
jgi:hypothetical protein